MSQPDNNSPPATLEVIQKSWNDLTLRVQQLEAGSSALEHENKILRQLVERVIEHRQKSHSELVNLLATLVSRLPINDVGVMVSRLVEHNAHITEVSSSLVKGRLEDNLLQPAILKALDKARRELAAAVKPEVENLLKLNAPFEAEMLQALVENPGSFFSPAGIRASRGYVKGQVPRERVVKEFGEAALIFFKDVTTDAKFNPRPKPEEIMLAFKPEFAELLEQHPDVAAARRAELQALHRSIRQSREDAQIARAQKNAFLRLSFFLELLHYYDNQNTESPDVVFAQCLPPLVEQLATLGERTALDEALVQSLEAMLALIVNADHRRAVINNMGKGGGLTRMLRYTLAFRQEKLTEMDPLTIECMKYLIPPDRVPESSALAAAMRLFSPHMQRSVIHAIAATERLRREDAEKLAKAVAQELGLQEIFDRLAQKSSISPEQELKMAWDHIKDLIASQSSPNEVLAAIRKRLHGRYEVDEVKACWIVLTEADPMVFVRVFCLFPYMPDGQADPLARAILETFVTRLTHEKYGDIYAKVVAALKKLFKVKPDSPALVNFISLVKWVDPAAAGKISRDIGMTA